MDYKFHLQKHPLLVTRWNKQDTFKQCCIDHANLASETSYWHLGNKSRQGVQQNKFVFPGYVTIPTQYHVFDAPDKGQGSWADFEQEFFSEGEATVQKVFPLSRHQRLHKYANGEAAHLILAYRRLLVLCCNWICCMLGLSLKTRASHFQLKETQGSTDGPAEQPMFQV